MFNNGWYPPPFYYSPHGGGGGGGGGSDAEAMIKIMEFLDKRNKPLPNGTDLDKYLRLMERMERKEEKKKKDKEEEEKKKKEKEKGQMKAPMFSGIQVFLILIAFGAPVGWGWLAVMKLMQEVILK